MIWKIRTYSSLPELKQQVLYLIKMNSGVGISYQFRNLKIEKGTEATAWTPAPEDTIGNGDYPNSIFTNTIPVKKNTQYAYGLENAGTLPAHTVRYLKSDGTYIRSEDIAENQTSGIRTVTFDGDYDIEIMFPDGLTDDEKNNFYYRRIGIMSKFLDTAGLTYLWSKIKTALGKKVDKVDGKGLSTNDYTTAEKNKLTGIADGANKYVHPSYTAKTNGLYKVTVDATGHVSATTAVTKTDITNLGVPGSNTTYSDFKGATADAAGAHGLVPAPAKGTTGSFLKSDGSWQALSLDKNLGLDEGFLELNWGDSYSRVIIPAATASLAGFMPAAMYTKLNDLPTNATLASTYVKKTDITGVYKYKGSLADATKLPTTGQVTGDVYNLEAASDYGPAGTNVAWDGKAWDALGGLFVVDAITNAEIDAICV